MADSSEDEDYVRYGTALEPLEEDEVRRKPVALQDQVVTDQQGRRRFHGAFTGGFSAGYFNTVGTKEGWTPSTFVSSRVERAKQSAQVVEDFMDEDDLGEFGIAHRKIVTAKVFSREDQARKRLVGSIQHHAIPGEAPLQDLVLPSHESIGVQLLKKMGWKEGQGVGPKERQKKKGKRDHPSTSGSVGVKQYGCAPPPEQTSDSSDNVDLDRFARDFFFAPKDSQEFAFRAKDNCHGIGYRGLDPCRAVIGGGHFNLFGDDTEAFGSSGKKGMRGQAFGTGVFEEEDDSIYSSDHMSRYDRVLGGEEPDDGNFGWTAPPQHRTGSESVVEGFKPAGEAEKVNKNFPAPSLPKDFRPFHSFAPSEVSSRPSPAAVDSFKSKSFMLSAAQRGAMLGETQLPGPTSVFEMISNDDKDKIKQAQNQLCKLSASTAPPVRPAQPLTVAPTSCDSKFQYRSGTGFQPFVNDTDKQRRYEVFLEKSKSSTKDSHTDVPIGNMTEWEHQRELEEFTRAANIYRPLSGLMATRFVTAKHKDEDTVDVAAEEGGDKNDQVKAAEMKMFGKLTRDTFQWHPDKLLCKRFNVPDPYPRSTIIGLPKVKKDTFSVFNFLTISTPEEPPPPAQVLAIEQIPHQTMPLSTLDYLAARKDGNCQRTGESDDPTKSGQVTKSSRWDQNMKLLSGAEKLFDNSKTVSSSKSSEDFTSEDRPPMDLFKAIFQSSSSSSSSSSSEDEESGDDDKVNYTKETATTRLQEETEFLEGNETHKQHDQSSNSGLQDMDKVFDAAVINTGEEAQTQLCYIVSSNTSNQPDGQANMEDLTSRLTEDKYRGQEDSEKEYGPMLPPTSSIRTERTLHLEGADDRDKDRPRQREHRNSRYQESYEERQSHSPKSKKHRHRSRMRDKDSDIYLSKSKSSSRHRGHQRSLSEDGQSRHSRKEHNWEKHKDSEKDKHRHRHKKKKTKKKKKKEENHKSGKHKPQRKHHSDASSDYDASGDDTGAE